MTIVKSEKVIKRNIINYIDRNGGEYSLWYVSISENPDHRLFIGHNVDMKNDKWIYEIASNFEIARRIEDYFVKTLGTDCAKCGGDLDARVIYAYKKNPHTTP